MGPRFPAHPRRSVRTNRRRHFCRMESLEPRTLLSATGDLSGRPLPTGPAAPTAAIFLSTSSRSTSYGTPVNCVAHLVTTGIAATDGTVIDFIDQQDSGNVLLSAVTVQNNLAAFAWVNGSVGDHRIVAQIDPTQSVPATASEPMMVAVAPALTITGITPSGNSIVAHVNSAALVQCGTVSFFQGTREIATAIVGADGSATFSTSHLRIGKHVLVAAYNGSTNYQTSVSTPLVLHLRAHTRAIAAAIRGWAVGRDTF